MFCRHREFTMFCQHRVFSMFYKFKILDNCINIGISLCVIIHLADILFIWPDAGTLSIKSFALIFRYPFYFIFFLNLLTIFCLCSQNIEISLCFCPPNTIKSFAYYLLLNLSPYIYYKIFCLRFTMNSFAYKRLCFKSLKIPY